MKRYNLIIAVTLTLVLMVSGAEAKKFARAHEQLQNVSIHGLNITDFSAKIRSMIADISFATSKFKKELLSEDAAPGLDGGKTWLNDVPVNDVPPYSDPNISAPNPDVSASDYDPNVSARYGGRKPIRWFMRYQAVRNSD